MGVVAAHYCVGKTIFMTVTIVTMSTMTSEDENAMLHYTDTDHVDFGADGRGGGW